ncbi:MAG: GAF domain-containing protein [Anaerolineae bacterium]|nr:MAG: GAF domain-containing protein [Anaerolineae bacterium]
MSDSDYIPMDRRDEAQAKAWVELLFNVSREFSASLELDDTLGRVLSMTVQMVGASEGSIFLLEPNGAVSRSIIARSELPPEIKTPTIETVMREGFAGWVYATREAMILPDTRAEPRWHEFEGDRLNTRSAIGLPITRREQVIGLLTLTHPEPERFSARHLNVLRPIAEQAARAIENASLFTRTRNERATLNAVIQAVLQPILVFDEARTLLLHNQSARQALSLSHTDIGKPMSELLAEPALLAYCQSARPQDEPVREIEFRDGRIFDCSLDPVPGLGVVVSLHDITALKRLDTLKSEFVAHVSHDLKNPLAIIRGYAGMVAQDGGDTPIGQFGTKILGGVDRMQELIENLLDIGKIELGIESEFAALDLAALARDVVDSQQALADERGITLTAAESPASLPVSGSRIRLSQAVTNLVGNAIKFTPAGGTVTVGMALEGAQAHLWVKDTGPGIPPGLQSKLFQKFSKLGQEETQRAEGHGLGLAIVRAVVEAHRGRLWVESAPGEGSAFHFSVPVESAA